MVRRPGHRVVAVFLAVARAPAVYCPAAIKALCEFRAARPSGGAPLSRAPRPKLEQIEKYISLSLARSLVPTVLIINGADWGAGHWAAVAGRARVACATREFPAAVRFIPRVRTGHCVPARVYVFRVFEAARFSHFRQQSGRRCASFSRSTFGPAARAPHLLRRF